MSKHNKEHRYTTTIAPSDPPPRSRDSSVRPRALLIRARREGTPLSPALPCLSAPTVPGIGMSGSPKLFLACWLVARRLPNPPGYHLKEKV